MLLNTVDYSSKIRDCRTWSILKILSGCRTYRHSFVFCLVFFCYYITPFLDLKQLLRDFVDNLFTSSTEPAFPVILSNMWLKTRHKTRQKTRQKLDKKVDMVAEKVEGNHGTYWAPYVSHKDLHVSDVTIEKQTVHCLRLEFEKLMGIL